MITLGIETSCDETAVAVLQGDRNILANEIASQTATHSKFGGIVPEIAARMHAQVINHVLDAALCTAGAPLEKIDRIAVTVGPGLAVSLVVGIACARALGAVLNRPVIGVNHLEAHLMSNFLTEPEPELPAICLLVSGGHTEIILVNSPGEYRVLGRTRDDAAGEAFDKVARLLGLEYPGGPAIQKAAQAATAPPVKLPRPMLHHESLDFSFSGLKTAVINYLKKQEESGISVDSSALAAGFQDAVVDVLTKKTLRAAKENRVKTVLLCGGVAANATLREQFEKSCKKSGFAFFSPPLILCTDNAAMVARAAIANKNRTSLLPTLSPQPNISF